MRLARLERWRPLASLSARLLLAYLGAWLLAAALAGASIAWFLRGDPQHWTDHSTLGIAHDMAQRLVLNAQGQPVSAPWPEGVQWLAQASPLDLGWRVFDAQGRVLLWSSPEVERLWQQADRPPAARPEHGEHGRMRVAGQVLRVRTVAIEQAATPLWLEVGLSERLVSMLHQGKASRLGGTVVATVLASIALLGLVLFGVLRHLMKPVRAVSQQARELDPRRPGQRLSVPGLPLELQPMVQAFNGYLQRLEEAHARQLQFLADAAHELKTPLMLLRAQLELGDAQTEVLLRDIDHLTRQVQQWLVLAEVTEPRSYHPEPLDVAEVAAEVRGRLAPLAARHGVTLQQHGATTPGLLADRVALAVLLKNLVENAIGFAPRGSAVLLALDAHGLSVLDQGGGMQAEHLPHLFERFWRAPSRRDTGAGLGLAICQEVAQAHGWVLQAHNTGQGAEFKVLFHPTTAAATTTAATATSQGRPC